MPSRNIILGIAGVMLLAGCASTGSSVHWWAPSTWWSSHPATAVDKANKNEDAAAKEAIKQAQKSSHETQVALGSAGNSRPVTVARDSAATTTGLLDQVNGAPTLAEAEATRKTVAGLLSDDPAARSAAELERSSENKSVADISTRLAKAQAATEAADKNLREAFDRENELANELRSAHALHWILGGCLLLALIGWIYVRFFLGGLPGAMGGALAMLERTHPDFTGTPENPGPLRVALNQLTNRHEQTILRDAYVKAR